jgi:anti-sigma B factor antagonist
MTLSIRIKQTKPGLVTLFPVGSIDSDTAPKLDQEVARLLAEPIKTLVLDMEEVGFISSAGVGTIAKAKTLLNRQGAELAMINLQPQIKKVFEIIRMLPTFNVFESVRELDEYLAKVQNNILDE